MTTSGKSLMNVTKKKSGPSNEPWGTPDGTTDQVELLQPMTTFCSLWQLPFFLFPWISLACHLFVGKLAYCMLNRWRHDQPHSSRYKVMHMYIKTPQNLVQIRSYFEKRAKWFLHGSEVARHPSTNSFSQPASQWPAEQAENKLRARAQNATRERGAHVRVEKKIRSIPKSDYSAGVVASCTV